jgi:hypothetical protein
MNKGATMNGIAVLQQVMDFNDFVVTKYLGDLSDADLLVRTSPGANHIAWQLGHLISAEKGIVTGQLPGAAYPELPAGFDEQHNKDATAKDTGFPTKAQYLDLYANVRAATRAAFSKLSDADLDKPSTGRMAAMFPKLGTVLTLAANHPLMHSGQFAAVRRKLGKPVVI